MLLITICISFDFKHSIINRFKDICPNPIYNITYERDAWPIYYNNYDIRGYKMECKNKTFIDFDEAMKFYLSLRPINTEIHIITNDREYKYDYETNELSDWDNYDIYDYDTAEYTEQFDMICK